MSDGSRYLPVRNAFYTLLPKTSDLPASTVLLQLTDEKCGMHKQFIINNTKYWNHDGLNFFWFAFKIHKLRVDKSLSLKWHHSHLICQKDGGVACEEETNIILCTHRECPKCDRLLCFQLLSQGRKVTNHCSGIHTVAAGLGSAMPRLEWMNFGNFPFQHNFSTFRG